MAKGGFFPRFCRSRSGLDHRQNESLNAKPVTLQISLLRFPKTLDEVEIVSDKTAEIEMRVFSRYGSAPEAAMMIGNSLRSDEVPALQAGAWGIHVPHEMTWDYEAHETPVGHVRFVELLDLSGLPGLLEGVGSR